jgi:F0F1-type ATP synthase membrane subunit b/b'
MADHEGSEPRDPQIPGEVFRSSVGIPALDLAEALGGLDRATREFTRRLGEGRESEGVPTVSSRFAQPQAAAGAASAEVPKPKPAGIVDDRVAAKEDFEMRMGEAEREAREYLDHAKRRADSLISTMLDAVEQDAAEMRREAEAGIRMRWQEVEVDAQRHVGEARRIAESMVDERQRRIAELSDEITRRAQALTTGMDDADRVRAQFDSFVRSLSVTADQIAGGGIGTMRKAVQGRYEGDRASSTAA